MLYRSSQNARGISIPVKKFEANCLVDWHLGPSFPFKEIGKPMIIPPTFNSSMMDFMRAKFSENRVLLMVFKGLAIIKSGSDTLKPIVLLPKSTPKRHCPDRMFCFRLVNSYIAIRQFMRKGKKIKVAF